MGNIFSNTINEEVFSNTIKREEQIVFLPQPKMGIKIQMNHIVTYWTRHNTKISFPVGIINIIIDAYTFIPYFEKDRNSRLTYPHQYKVKSHPNQIVYSTSKKNYHHKIEITLVGDSNVGKSSFKDRYIKDYFQSDGYLNDALIDLETKDLIIDNQSINIQIWDIKCNQRHSNNNHQEFYFRSHGVFVLYDITDNNSLQYVQTLHNLFDKVTPRYDIVKILVGTKSDEKDVCSQYKTQVNENNVQTIYKEFNYDHLVEISSKLNTNVNESWNIMIKEILKREKLFEIRKICPFYDY